MSIVHLYNYFINFSLHWVIVSETGFNAAMDKIS